MDTLLAGVRVALSLGVVLGVLWYAQRRFTRGGSGKRAAGLVSVVGRQGIGQKASVVVVDVDGSRFVLGVTEQAVTVLHSGAAVPAAPAAQAVDDAFTRALTTASDELEPPLEFRPRRERHASARPAKLGGSILSAATWQQTAAALRQGR